jgi:hypothetical protein
MLAPERVCMMCSAVLEDTGARRRHEDSHMKVQYYTCHEAGCGRSTPTTQDWFITGGPNTRGVVGLSCESGVEVVLAYAALEESMVRLPPLS